MRRFAATATSLPLLLALAVPATGGQKPRTPSWWSPGEELAYTASVGFFREAALIEIRSLPAVDDQPEDTLRLLINIRPGPVTETLYPFSYESRSSVGRLDLLPREASRRVVEGSDDEFVVLDFDHPAGEVRLAERAAGPPVGVDPIDDTTRDLAALICGLRSLGSEATERFQVYENRRLYQVTIQSGEVERVEVPGGTFEARRYQLEIDPRGERLTDSTIVIWISTGPERIPLRITASTALGELSLELTGRTTS
jgi:Protein of unknown function (DUF3108)